MCIWSKSPTLSAPVSSSKWRQRYSLYKVLLGVKSIKGALSTGKHSIVIKARFSWKEYILQALKRNIQPLIPQMSAAYRKQSQERLFSYSVLSCPCHVFSAANNGNFCQICNNDNINSKLFLTATLAPNQHRAKWYTSFWNLSVWYHFILSQTFLYRSSWSVL